MNGLWSWLKSGPCTGRTTADVYTADKDSTVRVSLCFYQRLLNTGKAKKVGLVACTRKLLIILNAMMRTMTVWQPKIILRCASVEAS